VDVAVRSGVLIEMEHQGPPVRVPHGDPGLLERLTERRDLGRLTRLDVSAGLQPATDAAVQVQEHTAVALVEHDGRRGHVRRERAPGERVVRSREQLAEARDGVLLEIVERRMVGEEGEELGATRIVDREAQLRISFASTAPVLSRS
jgi:hypothetical protein